MYSATKEIALEALKHCIHLDDPFCELNCGSGCPLWKQCSFTSLEVILTDLCSIILSHNIPAERYKKIIAGIQCCVEYEQSCDTRCPYWTICEGEQLQYLFRDIYDLLNEYGLYLKE